MTVLDHRTANVFKKQVGYIYIFLLFKHAPIQQKQQKRKTRKHSYHIFRTKDKIFPWRLDLLFVLDLLQIRVHRNFLLIQIQASS